MDKIKATEVNVVFTDDNLPEEMMAKMKELFPNAVFKRASEATGDEAAQINKTAPAAEDSIVPQVLDFVSRCLLQCEATTTGCEHHKSVCNEATTTGCEHHKSVCNEPTEKEPSKRELPADVVRKVAYGKLMQVAEEYGLRFNQQELAALFMLSAAADPQVAINTAHDMCRRFVGAWGV